MTATRLRAGRDAAPVLLLLWPAEPKEPEEAAVPSLLLRAQLTHVYLARSRAVLQAAYTCLDAAYEHLSHCHAPRCVASGR
jgi:hypothetical protein